MTETVVRVQRPFKLIATIFAAIAVLLVIIGVSAERWVEVKFQAGTDNWKTWGLWTDCHVVTSALRVCVETAWRDACAALSLVGLFGAVGTVCLGIVGLCTHKRIVYIIAGVIALISAILLLIALIVFPVKFTEQIHREDQDNLEEFSYDWTYGITFGGMLFLIGAAIFFFLKQETQEVDEKSMPPYYINSGSFHS